MKRLIVLLTLAASAFSQQLPDAPKPRVFDWKFAAVASIPVAGYGLDYGSTFCSTQGHKGPVCPRSTITGLPQQRNCVETNPLFGPHPRTIGLTAIAAAEIGAADGLAYWLKKKHAKLWWIPPVLSGGSHLVFASINLSRGCY